MLDIGGLSNFATISRQQPVGMVEAERIVREKEKASIVTNNSQSSSSIPVKDNQDLNTTPSQRINDTSGVNAQSRMNAQDDEQSSQEQQMKIDQVVSQLKARDREVRAHEQAHLAVAGQYATGLSYTYQSGPDGKRYAIGGEVGIDTSAVSGDPEATIQKMMVVQSAAMAPAQPSAQDYRVASSARQAMAEARAELSAQQMEASQSSSNVSNSEKEVVDNEEAQQPRMIADRAAFETRLQMPTGHEMVADLVNPS
ncbi:putative metalloprotease CJM1_0395 family protein [Thiomicrorhabdus indica]|uniref:putative metalloprotease CJM1_0395 family protein n=1 Tax=Thiomicrorhabdus indica TaxID=2267253 RepID=UPI002AA70A3C|nr:putative metalloprotease CJM1_0395 family protein [Thiomicrorhabdus indica]